MKLGDLKQLWDSKLLLTFRVVLSPLLCSWFAAKTFSRDTNSDGMQFDAAIECSELEASEARRLSA